MQFIFCIVLYCIYSLFIYMKLRQKSFLSVWIARYINIKLSMYIPHQGASTGFFHALRRPFHHPQYVPDRRSHTGAWRTNSIKLSIDQPPLPGSQTASLPLLRRGPHSVTRCHADSSRFLQRRQILGVFLSYLLI